MQVKSVLIIVFSMFGVDQLIDFTRRFVMGSLLYYVNNIVCCSRISTIQKSTLAI